MNQDQIFSYSYSAKENSEVLEIRKKYLPQSESKIDELKRLDALVQGSGVVDALCAGFIGFMLLDLGVCLAVQVIGFGGWLIALGILLAIVGIIGMAVAYPVYRKIFIKTKAKNTPRILELAVELSGDKKVSL